MREKRDATSDIAEEFAVATEQFRKEKLVWAEHREKWPIEEDNKLRREAMTKSTDSLEGMISDWGRAKTIHQFFDKLEDAIALS